MMETRISKCMEATGKSREACSKEVKTRMKKNGSENTNTDTIDKKEIKEADKESTKDKGNKVDNIEEEVEADMVDICPKKLDMLTEKAKKWDEQQIEIDDLKKDFKDAMDYVNKIKEKEAKDLEVKRQDKIEKLSNDFQIPKSEIENDTIEDLEKTRRRLDFALNTEKGEDVDIEESTQDYKDAFRTRVDALNEKYRVKF